DFHVTGVQTCALPIYALSRLSSCQPYSFSLLVLSRLLKQRVQRIKPSRQCIDVLARRNAQAVQAAGHALVESLLDLLETTFHLRSEERRVGRESTPQS